MFLMCILWLHQLLDWISATLVQKIDGGREEYLVLGGQNNFCAGESPSFRQGVFLYWRSARESWSQLTEQPVQAAEISFFMDFTVASALPLLCG